MNPNKTTVLRFKPIEQITEDERKEEVLATDCNGNWSQGKVYVEDYGYSLLDQFLEIVDNIKLYAVLPKD